MLVSDSTLDYVGQESPAPVCWHIKKISWLFRFSWGHDQMGPELVMQLGSLMHKLDPNPIDNQKISRLNLWSLKICQGGLNPC